MPTAPPSLGRRERNKQAKLERITAAASALFAQHGVDDVTTQQIANAADIGAGTLFLYAKTKGELLLLVQNTLYAEALERGRAAASAPTSLSDAVHALITPIVECNRAQIDNGRTYLREMVFGDPSEPHHAEALSIVARTDEAMAELFEKHSSLDERDALELAHVISAIMFVTMAASVNAKSSTEEILSSIRSQIAVTLPR